MANGTLMLGEVGMLDGGGKPPANKRVTIARAVGQTRAAEVVALVDPLSLRERTTPELVVEAFLIKRGVQFEKQVELGFARPDFVLFNLPDAPDGAVVLNVQGERWHKDKVYADMGKARAMVNMRVSGIPITHTVEVWEKDINQGEAVLEDALRLRPWRVF